jgi:hypothetical protein
MCVQDVRVERVLWEWNYTQEMKGDMSVLNLRKALSKEMGVMVR